MTKTNDARQAAYEAAVARAEDRAARRASGEFAARDAALTITDSDLELAD